MATLVTSPGWVPPFQIFLAIESHTLGRQF